MLRSGVQLFRMGKGCNNDLNTNDTVLMES